MLKIIECVPNVSEGRNYRTIEKLANVLRAVKEVQLLDIQRDIDHNRSVFTFIGTPAGVQQAAYDLVETASELIDINAHSGVHPRLGAVDVIPLVPVANISVAECVKIAEKLGEEIEKHLHVPVFFYEKATSDPRTKNLADLRAQGYNLKKHHTAGATAIGVRDYLVAYNVELGTDKLEIAKDIAGRIREKNGGLKGVKALGLKLASKKRVQVSMNLTKPQKTTCRQAAETVGKLAKKYKIKVVGCELVGLLPEQVREAAKRF